MEEAFFFCGADRAGKKSTVRLHIQQGSFFAVGPFEEVSAPEDVIEGVFFRLSLLAFTFPILQRDKPAGGMDVQNLFEILHRWTSILQ